MCFVVVYGEINPSESPDYWISRMPLFGISSYGQSKEEARDNVMLAVTNAIDAIVSHCKDVPERKFNLAAVTWGENRFLLIFSDAAVFTDLLAFRKENANPEIRCLDELKGYDFPLEEVIAEVGSRPNLVYLQNMPERHLLTNENFAAGAPK